MNDETNEYWCIACYKKSAVLINRALIS